MFMKWSRATLSKKPPIRSRSLARRQNIEVFTLTTYLPLPCGACVRTGPGQRGLPECPVPACFIRTHTHTLSAPLPSFPSPFRHIATRLQCIQQQEAHSRVSQSRHVAPFLLSFPRIWLLLHLDQPKCVGRSDCPFLRLYSTS